MSNRSLLLAAVLLIAIGCSSSDEPAAEDPAPDDAAADGTGGSGRRGGRCAGRRTRDGAPSSPPSTVRERAGVARPIGVLEAGVPLAEGLVDAGSELELDLAVLDGDQLIPARFRVLSSWPDGSVRWAGLIMPLALEADEVRTLQLVQGAGPGFAPDQPTLPALTVWLDTPDGRRTFADIEDGYQATEGDNHPRCRSGGPHSHPRPASNPCSAGPLRRRLVGGLGTGGPRPRADRAGRRGGCRAGWCVDRCASSSDRAAPYRCRGRRRCAAPLPLPSRRPAIPGRPGLSPDPERSSSTPRPDRPRSLALSLRPLRAEWPPEYAAETHAAGIFGVGVSELDEAFLESWRLMRARRAEAPELNRTWTAWGDMVDRHGAAYLGYLCQEYDPSAAFFLYHLRTGDPDALDEALDMARQYADSCLSLRGGSFEHRATTSALIDTIGRAAATVMRDAWHEISGGGPLGDDGIAAWMEATFGAEAGRRTASGLRDLDEDDPVPARAHHERVDRLPVRRRRTAGDRGGPGRPAAGRHRGPARRRGRRAGLDERAPRRFGIWPVSTSPRVGCSRCSYPTSTPSLRPSSSATVAPGTCKTSRTSTSARSPPQASPIAAGTPWSR